MLNLINHERVVNIVTLEDPIEFIFNSEKSIVMQRQLGTDMVSFQSALKHVLRQDPDIVMVGEMRDLETIAATLTLAETGHLVLATLHTHNAAQTIDRVVDVFPPCCQQYEEPVPAFLLSKSIAWLELVRFLGLHCPAAPATFAP